jgi:hypothetical protein
LTGIIHEVSLHTIRITLMRSILQNGIMIYTSSTNIQDDTFVVLCGLIFSWTILMLPEMAARVSSVYFSLF